ncbi:MAG TPA: efflux RND transporter permease subunit [Alphaproteobacteria bacterium]|nr:efflux RND transporter permease subunit [Alphaproteobacteria bacterium]
MTLPELCIRRPVMTTLLMATLLIFGLVSYRSLPVSELPNIDFPTILVTAALPGASPETMAATVAKPLEAQFSTIASVASMNSSSALGLSQITLQFTLDRDIDAAAQDVLAAIAAAGRNLPSGMPSPPTIRKVNPAEQPVLYLAMSSATLPLSTVDEYAQTVFAQSLSMVPGVALVQVYGSQKYALRVQVDPGKLAVRGIGIDEVERAVRGVNSNLPTGTLDGAKKSMTIRTTGKIEGAATYGRQIVAYRNGAAVRLAELGRVIDGVENERVASWFSGKRAIILAIQRQPGSNTVKVVGDIKASINRIKRLLPASVQFNVIYDRSLSIKESIHDVQFTLLLAALLVIMVIFLFLRRLWATVIPAVALPLSAIGTFTVMAMFGFSLDNLSLMALTLSVGFVVDDAIVMLENIVRHIEKGETPMAAALKGSREIGFTIISMTISLAAVFIPVVFLGGVVGRLLNEFAVTIVAAILISGFVSLTLTPMMCARLLKDDREVKHGALFRAIECGFDSMLRGYERSLRWCVNHGPVMLLVFAFSVAATVHLFRVTPRDFLPSEDTGRIVAFTSGGQDISFTAMKVHQQRIAAIIARNPNVEAYMSSVGAGGPRATSNSGTIFIRLKPRDQRKAHVDQIMQQLRRQVANVPGIRVFFQNPPPVRFGAYITKGSYQYVMESLDIEELYRTASAMQLALRRLPGLQDVSSDMDISSPQAVVVIDRNQAAALGVSPEQIESALASAFGMRQISTISTSSNQYQVILEVRPQDRENLDALSQLYVRSSAGPLIPLSAVVTIKQGVGPLTVNHRGQLPSVTLSFNLRPGVSVGTALASVRALERQIRLPATVATSFQGAAEAFASSTESLGILIILALVVVYIVLGILYESFIHPLTILSGLPSASFGALLMLQIFNVPLSLYAFVGVIMLIGIVKKNAIMMIDFALARQRADNLPANEAIFEACLVRFRPIMMTTMAALLGTLPIAIAFGAGAEARQPLGLAVVGGLLVSQLLTLYLTPVIYVYLDRLSHWRPLRRGSAIMVPAE